MESVYSRFESYDFAADRRFQDGLKTLEENSKHETRLLDMKLFFYNRFMEPIDQTGYKRWRSAAPPVTQMDCESLHQRTLTDTDSDIRNIQTAETVSAGTDATPLSFAEVMRLVQEGKEVPGVMKLEVKPTNQSPTPSQMERILKPWEVSSDSK